MHRSETSRVRSCRTCFLLFGKGSVQSGALGVREEASRPGSTCGLHHAPRGVPARPLVELRSAEGSWVNGWCVVMRISCILMSQCGLRLGVPAATRGSCDRRAWVNAGICLPRGRGADAKCCATPSAAPRPENPPVRSMFNVFIPTAIIWRMGVVWAFHEHVTAGVDLAAWVTPYALENRPWEVAGGYRWAGACHAGTDADRDGLRVSCGRLPTRPRALTVRTGPALSLQVLCARPRQRMVLRGVPLGMVAPA